MPREGNTFHVRFREHNGTYAAMNSAGDAGRGVGGGVFDEIGRPVGAASFCRRGYGMRGLNFRGYPPPLPKLHTGMPSFLALSARLSWMPVPGNTTTPIGNASSMASLRLNGAALACRVQSGR